MSLPPSLLAALESHECFSGVFAYDATVQMVVDPAAPPEPGYVVHCSDCLLWHAGALCRDLPSGVDGYALAKLATAHVASARGYAASVGGYHGAGGGFWLSAVYLRGIDLFLLDGHRSRSMASDIDLLVRSFQLGVWKHDDAGMTDPARYTLQVAHVAMAGSHGSWPRVQDFLASPAVRASSCPATRTVTLASYQRAASPAARPAPAAKPAPLRAGEVCPTCGQVVRWRQLLTSSYLGCMC